MIQKFWTYAIQKSERARKKFLDKNIPMAIELDLELVGMRLEAVRLVCGTLKQQQFAESIGASKQQYNNWTKGYPLPVAYAAELVRQYKITLDWIYLGDPSGLPFERKEPLERAVSDLTKSKVPRRVAIG
jgi:transcriptional regulator with XRE-family HTH domain